MDDTPCSHRTGTYQYDHIAQCEEVNNEELLGA
jgi:hypothetical protein